MDDQWEALALRLPETLVRVSSGMEAVRLIEVALGKFQERATMMGRILDGMPAATAEQQYDDPAPVGVCPTMILEKAHREILLSTSRHAMVRGVFTLYSLHHRMQDEEPFRHLDSQHQDAIGHFEQAMRNITDAVGHYAAAEDIVIVNNAFLPQEDEWRRWASAAKLLIDRAANLTTLARDEARQARHVVALEFFETWPILRQGEARLVAIGVWRETALTLLGTLRLIGTAAMEAFGLIQNARSKLHDHVALVQAVRQGTLVAVVVDYFADPVPEEVLMATVILDIAHREISETAVRHAKTHHIFVRYAAHLGIQDDQAYRIWESHHQEATGHFKQALMRIRNSISNFEVARDAVAMICVLPNRSELWEGWAMEVYTFTVAAAVYTQLAMDEVNRARHAVSGEFMDAWMILRR